MTPASLFTGPLRYLPTLVVTATLAWLILSPDPLPSHRLAFWDGADKMAHALMFGGLAAILLSDAFRRRKISFPGFVFILLLCSGAGAAIEILQREMGLGRHADRYDFIADAIGVAAASAAWLLGRCSHR